MPTATEEKIDQVATLQMLEPFIGKRSDAARIRDIVNRQYCEVRVCETKERRTSQLVDQQEGRVKTHHRQLLLRATKPAELSSLKQEHIEAEESLNWCRQELEERSARCPKLA